ncbi:hypothetical protein B0H14DRAFT_2615950 [Mycena olivaceomarginata]|nr:hypothetical protein B0H14DRAFT_2615950 [Mycena olivaceomarginata]
MIPKPGKKKRILSDASNTKRRRTWSAPTMEEFAGSSAANPWTLNKDGALALASTITPAPHVGDTGSAPSRKIPRGPPSTIKADLSKTPAYGAAAGPKRNDTRIRAARNAQHAAPRKAGATRPVRRSAEQKARRDGGREDE